MEYDKQKIKEIVLSCGYKKEMSDIIIKTCDYLKKKQWWGACHACSSVLYVLLSEIGYNPTLCVGEVQTNNYLFDHSWIEVDNKIIDLAISLTLKNGMAVSSPIILDINSTTKEKTQINYGVKGQGFDEQTKILLSLSFNEYMNYFPDNENGLWGVIEEILNKKIDIEKFQEKYKNTERSIRK